MRGWDIFQQMQAWDAYGNNAGTSYVADTLPMKKLIESAAAGRKFEKSLVIGPGGLNEIGCLREATAGEIYAVTTHRPEFDMIKTRCIADMGDMHELPYQSGVFDLVFCSNVMEHAFAPYVALMHIRRVLKSGGVFLCVVPVFDTIEGGKGPFHLHCLDEKVWLELLRKTGLQPGWRQTSDHYYTFSCVATALESPHDRIMERLTECWSIGQ